MLAERLELASQLAHVTVHAREADVVQIVKERTDDWGVELAVDAAGTEITRQQGVAAIAPRGTLVLVGLGHGETTINYLPVVNRELIVRGSYCYTDDDFQRALEIIADGQIDAGKMIHVAPLTDGVDLFEKLATDPAGLAKVVLKPESL